MKNSGAKNSAAAKDGKRDILGESGESPDGGKLLALTSFFCGACVMILEMAGSRVVAPYMGTSLVVWTSLIGVIMASLTLGYWVGGIAADRHPSRRLLAMIIGWAAAVTLAVSFAANPLLSALSSIRSVYAGSFVAAVLLFAFPSALLGMVSPFIARLAMRSLGEAGGTVGRYSALSSAGSIVGTFLGGFVLISFLSTHTILFLVALVLGVVALLLHRGSGKISASVIFLSLIFGLMSEGGAIPMKLEGVTIDTHYNNIRVMERVAYGTNLKVRILQTDPMGAQSLMYVDRPDDLYSDYTKFYDLAFHYSPGIKNVLMLGGGGYCVPKHIGATRPGVAVDVVELDPGITKAAREYFGLRDRESQRIFHEDARSFINRESASGKVRYGAVFGDVFGSSYNIPFHMTTSECMNKIRSLLSDDGVFVVNIISSLDGELFSGIYSSIASVFPVVMIYPATYPNSAATRQNIMIVALASGDVPRDRPPENDYMASLLAHRWTSRFEPKIAAFTDAFAPVEKYSLKP